VKSSITELINGVPQKDQAKASSWNYYYFVATSSKDLYMTLIPSSGNPNLYVKVYSDDNLDVDQAD